MILYCAQVCSIILDTFLEIFFSEAIKLSKNLFIKIGFFFDKLQNSRYFLPALFGLSLLSLIFDIELAGMLALIALCVLLLIFSDDLLSLLCPVLCILLLSTEYYTDYTRLIPVVPYVAVPFGAALVFNIVRYRMPIIKGAFTYPLAAVSLALIIGGVGVIPAKEYFRPVSLYYTLGLGVLMLLIYLLAISRLQRERDYDRTARLADILFTAGLLAASVIFVFYADNLNRFLDYGTVLFFKPRNYISSVLLMCLPASCLLIDRRRIHLIGFALMCAALVLSGSRSGLLFGAMVGFVCTVYICYLRKESIKLHPWYNWAFLLAVAAACYIAVRYIPVLYASRLVEGSFISTSETRVVFLTRGVADFLENPINGVGIGNLRNLEIFKAIIPGSIVFYHNSVIQIAASMGLVGIMAYSWLFGERIRMMVTCIRTPIIVFGFSYAGIFAMSLTNPGIFCPFPESALLITLFAVAESEAPRYLAELGKEQVLVGG